MKFIFLLIAGYVYFSMALFHSCQNFSYTKPAEEKVLLNEITEPMEFTGAKVALAKTASFVEKSGYPL